MYKRRLFHQYNVAVHLIILLGLILSIGCGGGGSKSNDSSPADALPVPYPDPCESIGDPCTSALFDSVVTYSIEDHGMIKTFVYDEDGDIFALDWDKDDVFVNVSVTFPDSSLPLDFLHYENELPTLQRANIVAAVIANLNADSFDGDGSASRFLNELDLSLLEEDIKAEYAHTMARNHAGCDVIENWPVVGSCEDWGKCCDFHDICIDQYCQGANDSGSVLGCLLKANLYYQCLESNIDPSECEDLFPLCSDDCQDCHDTVVNCYLYAYPPPGPSACCNRGDCGEPQACIIGDYIETDPDICNGDPTFIQSSKIKNRKMTYAKKSRESNGLAAKISVPYDSALVRANIPISGIAHGDNFKEYRVDFGEGRNPKVWTTLNRSSIPQKQDVTIADLVETKDVTIFGNLANWNTGLRNYVYLPSHPKNHPIDLKGTYTIRLVVTGKDGKSIEDRISVEVANVIPNAWGGKAISKDKKVVLTIPEQAIMNSFRLILVKRAQVSPTTTDSNHHIIGHIYEVREPGERFTKNALLEMQFSANDIKETEKDKLSIYGLNPKTNKWEHLKSRRYESKNIVFANIRQLHRFYTLMASDLPNEKSHEEVQLNSPKQRQSVEFKNGGGHVLIENTFEDNLGEWSNRDHEMGATVALDDTVTYDGTNALKVTNTHVGGNFAANVITTPFDAKVYPIVQFDYRIPGKFKTNFLVKVSGRWYDIGFTDDPKELKDKRINIAHIGDIDSIVVDDRWHTAQFNLYDMLRTKTGNSIVEAMIMADWDVEGYMKLTFGKNPQNATYYIDNFMVSREALVVFQAANDVILVDNFNQMNLTNTLGGQHVVFTDRLSGKVDLDFDKNTVDGKGRALSLNFDVSDQGSYAGYCSGMRNLDLRGFQQLTFLVKGATDGRDCMVGIRDSSGNESKVQLSRHLPMGADPKWRAVNIPLAAFTQVKDWGHIDILSFGFEHSFSPKGILYLDDLAFNKALPALKIDDFENADQKNKIGLGHHTFVSGNAAVNGKYTKGSLNGIYRISYGGNIGKIKAYASDLKSFAGWQTDLGGVDCSHSQYLSMHVRGAEGEENFTVYLSDGNFRWGVDVAKYGKITTDWQTITIPLTEFEGYGVDLTHLAELQVVFEGHQMSGTIYLDDLLLGSVMR